MLFYLYFLPQTICLLCPTLSCPFGLTTSCFQPNTWRRFPYLSPQLSDSGSYILVSLLPIAGAVDYTHICKQSFPFLQEQTRGEDTDDGEPATVRDSKQRQKKKKKGKVAPANAKPVAAAADDSHSSDDEV